MPKKQEVAQSVLDMVDWNNSISFKDGPGKHQFVTTGIQMGVRDPVMRLGYCVQIRKGRGQFGSDMVFLRHPNGNLSTHENQSYVAMTEEQEALAKTIFDVLPEDEAMEDGSDPEYRDCDKIGETGFLILDSKSEPIPNSPFTVTVKDSAGGVIESTHFN